MSSNASVPNPSTQAEGDVSVAKGALVTPDPSLIMQIGLGFMPSKVLLSAVGLGLFTALGSQALTEREIAERLALGSRAVPDFLDGLVALHLLERDGLGKQARYRNTPETALFLDRASPQYLGALFEFGEAWLNGAWAGLTGALQTAAHVGIASFEELYREPARLEQFIQAMAGVSMGNFHTLAERFDFSRYQTVCDVGGANAQLSIILAQRYPHLRCTSFDLSAVLPIAARTIQQAGLRDRVTAVAGDFFADRLPTADVITMSLILHDWDVERRRQLIRAAYEALPAGGAYIAISHMIDDERRRNVFALMVSLDLMLESGGSEYTPSEFSAWCTEAGFRSVEVLALAGASSAGVAYK